jgi:parallel beta-helix repeat protein
MAGKQAVLRRIVALCCAITASLAPVALSHDSISAAPAGVTERRAAVAVFVAPWGVDGSPGTFDEPVRTLSHAVWRARSGDAVVLRGGIYRENVQIYGKSIAVSSAPGERAVLDGSTELAGWQRSDEDWFVDGWTQQFPRQISVQVADDSPVAGFPDQVFFNGAPLTQVVWRSEVVPGTFFHDTARDRIYIADDPSNALVEASVESWALYFNNADGSTLADVTIRRFATPSEKVAAVRVYSNAVTISGVTVEFNAASGISVIGSDIVIRNSVFTDNGHLGIHAHNSAHLVIENSVVVGNNKAGFDARHSAGGIKVTESNDISIRGNRVAQNDGPGIWTDLSTSHVTIAGNRVEGNGRSGIEIELSTHVEVLGNVTRENGEAGIWILESQNVRVTQNSSYRNIRQIHVLEGERQEVANISIEGNIVGNGRAGWPLIVVENWTGRRSPEQMNVQLSDNTYGEPAPAPLR